MANETISHRGIVTQSIEKRAIVQLIDKSGCHACRLKSACGTAHEEDKTIEVEQEGLLSGDEVMVQLSKSNGAAAVMLAYIFPFILIIVMLAIGTLFGWKDQWSGLVSLLVLIPYYLSLALFRSKLRKQLHLKVSKL